MLNARPNASAHHHCHSDQGTRVRTAVRYAYSIAQGLNTAASTQSLFAKEQNLTSRVTESAISGLISGTTAYCFQGNSIANNGCGHDHELASYHHIASAKPAESTPLIQDSASKYTAINMPEDDEGSADNPYYYRHLAAELGLNLTSAYFTLSNRYFLLTNLMMVFGFTLSGPAFWTIVLSDSAFKVMFDLTNELFETNMELATAITKGVAKNPVYADWRLFKWLAGNSYIRDFVAILGTFEHSVVDDILPWLLLIPESALTKFINAYKHFNAASNVAKAFATLTPILGGFLSVIIIFQTMLFEAEHSYMAYRTILNDTTNNIKSFFDRSTYSKNFLNFMKYASHLMPACHGAAASTPVYLFMQQLTKLTYKDLFKKSSSMTHIFKVMGVIIVPIFTFISVTIGHYMSEFSEAREKIEDRICELEEVVAQA
jgi:hypothetical protein